MSRIGRQPIIIPEGVTVKVEGKRIIVTGSKGTLELTVRPEVKITVADGQILVARDKDDRISASLHGLSRALISNLVTGVTEGYSKTLKLVGTGYRVKQEGEKVILSVGFSHTVVVEPPDGIKLEARGNDLLTVSGIDKALVGQTAAKIRGIRPPEPYKGKGIRYEDEVVRKKAGKAGKAGSAGFSEGGQ